MKTIGRTRERARRNLLSKLRRLNGSEFEGFVELLFTKMGYDVTVTGGTGDDGIDLVAELGTGIGAQRVGIQAKCRGPNRSIGPNTVRLLRDALSTRQCNAGAVVATCRFDANAIEVAAEPGKPPVELIDNNRLTDLALEFKSGIRSGSLDIYREDLEGLFKVETDEA